MKSSEFDYIFGRDLPGAPDSVFRPPVAVEAAANSAQPEPEKIVPAQIIDVGPMPMSEETMILLGDFSSLIDPLHGYLSQNQIDCIRQFLFEWKGPGNIVSFLKHMDEIEDVDLSFFSEPEQRIIVTLAGLKTRIGGNYSKFLDTLNELKRTLPTNPELAGQLEEKLGRFHKGQIEYLISLLKLSGSEMTSAAKNDLEQMLTESGSNRSKSIHDVVSELLNYIALNHPDDVGMQRLVEQLKAAYPKFFRVQKKVFGGTSGNDRPTFKPGELDVAGVVGHVNSAAQKVVAPMDTGLEPPRFFSEADIAEMPPILAAGLTAGTVTFGKNPATGVLNLPKPLRIPILTAVVGNDSPTKANNFYLFFAENYRNLALSTADRANILSYIFDSTDTVGNGSERVVIDRSVHFLTEPGMLHIFQTFFNSDEEKFEPFMHALWLYHDSIVNLDEQTKADSRKNFAASLESLY